MNLNQVTLPAIDLARSIAFYRGMGFVQIVDSPRYARFECPDGDATLSLHLVKDASDGAGPVVYFECVDLDAQVQALENSGYQFLQPATDQPWLWREARLQDPAGNLLCLYRAGSNRRHPPWRMSGDSAPAIEGADR